MATQHSTNGKALRGAAYYRMSDDKQENSIERQRSQVEPCAVSEGVTIVLEYLDEGISGSEITRRRGFQRMLRDAQAGLFDVILCDDKDRFGRFDSIDLGEIVAPLRRKGVFLITVAQGRIDWDSFAGRITDAVLQEAKHEEQKAISRRVLSDQLLKAKQGKDTGGRPLYGYRRVPDPTRGARLVPDDRKAEVVKLIFRMCDEGHTLWAITEELVFGILMTVAFLFVVGIVGITVLGTSKPTVRTPSPSSAREMPKIKDHPPAPLAVDPAAPEAPDVVAPVEAAAPKPKAVPPPPKPAPPPPDPVMVEGGARRMELVKVYMGGSDTTTIKDVASRLEAIIKEFPGTPAAREAAEMLKKRSKP